ncbi:MAG: murein biosynthesis integral membrane protein MurJ [Patescibacteria group bacterium]|nr:murein biosynthesis integral membrane protein MurJ [Patescibacteria group bacterium]
MLGKFFNRQSQTITSAAIVLGAASLLSRLLGVLRDRILAGQFGAGRELDMYYAAFRIPDLIFNLLVVGALSAGLIPVLTKSLGNSKKTWEIVNISLNVLCFVLVLFGLLIFILADWVMKIITPGFSAPDIHIAANLTRIMMLSPMFLGMSGIFGSVLQSYKRFFLYSIAPIMYNIGIMIGALFLAEYFGIYGLALGVVLGTVLHMSIQLPAVVALGFKYQPIFDLTNTEFRKIVKLMVPRTMGLIISQVNFLVVTILGSTLAAGSIAIFSFANNIQSFPLGIFAISFAVAVFPTLSQLAEQKKEFINTLSLAVRQILFLIIPSSALLIVLRAQVVRVALGTGRFDWQDTVLTLETVALFAFSLFAQALVAVFVRAFYAQNDSRTPFFIGLISEIFNLGLAVMLIKTSGVAGLALAFSLANILNLVLLILALHYRMGKLDGHQVTVSVTKIVIATSLLVLVAQAVKYPMEQYFGTVTLFGVFLQATVATVAGGGTYLLICLLLKSEEALLFINSFKRKFLKNSILPEEIIENDKLV